MVVSEHPPNLVEDEERPSITEIKGTVARFEMAYNPNPTERFAFGPPLWQRLPSLLFVGFALVLVVATFLAHHAPRSSPLFRFIVEDGRTPFVGVIVLAALATFVRSGLRGVIVTREGVETRDLALGIPRVRKYRWAQIDRVIVDGENVMFELWNGSYDRLPRVREGEQLVSILERIAIGRGRTVTRLDAKR
jgi:hypothetical protein